MLSQNFLQLWRSALEQKKAEEKKVIGAIDYDAPTENNSSSIGLGTKVISLLLYVYIYIFPERSRLPCDCWFHILERIW